MPAMWYALDINPEPWAVGPLGVSRHGGKLTPYMGRNQQLDAYKEAVRDELITRYPGLIKVMPPYYELDFFFWRNQAIYEGANKTVQKNIADATNMQKATEDALQGMLIENDRQVVHVSSTIVAQGPDVRGAVAFRFRWGAPLVKDPSLSDLPVDVEAQIEDFTRTKQVSRNVWPPR